ncbi:MAG: hydroxymethylbilane synthase, partial [Candidatus Anammoxibacter sp.]
MSKGKIIIGSRGSKLAMIQANWTKDTLGASHPDIEFVIKEISTKGDRITDVPLSRLGGV